MKREIIELLLALVLVISLGLAIALPMSITDEHPRSGCHSYHLS